MNRKPHKIVLKFYFNDDPLHCKKYDNWKTFKHIPSNKLNINQNPKGFLNVSINRNIISQVRREICVVKSLEFIHVEFSYILNRLWGNNYATKTILITEQSILRRFNIMQPGINTLSRK